MRDQYKILSEKYKAINESDKDDIISGLGKLEKDAETRQETIYKMKMFMQTYESVYNGIVALARLQEDPDLVDAYRSLDADGLEDREEVELEFYQLAMQLEIIVSEQSKHNLTNGL